MDLLQHTIVDLTHAITETMPHWPGDTDTTISATTSIRSDGFYMQSVCMAEHAGTHIGAPRHFSADGVSVDNIPAKRLIVQAVKIDISASCEKNADYQLSCEDIERWERLHGSIPAGSLVLVQTGWDVHWTEPSQYYQRLDGRLVFPGISMQAAEHLIAQQIVGIGIDSPGIDGDDESFQVNRKLSGYNLYHLENLTNLDKLRNTGFLVFVGALAIRHGSGSTCRVLALQI